MMPTLQVRKENEGCFTVRVTWPDGAWQDIPGFEHESDADDWIAHKLPDWLEEQKMARAEQHCAGRPGRDARYLRHFQWIERRSGCGMRPVRRR